MKKVFLIVGIIFIIILCVTLAIRFIKPKFEPDQIEKVKYDSLQVQYANLKMAYDSVTRIQLDNERNFVALTVDQKEKISIYRRKIKDYEKEFAFIVDMSEYQLMDSITEYYHRRLGYNR